MQHVVMDQLHSQTCVSCRSDTASTADQQQPQDSTASLTDATQHDMQQQQVQQQTAGQAGTQPQDLPLTEQQQQEQQQQDQQQREAGQRGRADMGSVEGLTDEQLADKTHEHAIAAMMMGGGPPSWGGHFDNRYKPTVRHPKLTPNKDPWQALYLQPGVV